MPEFVRDRAEMTVAGRHRATQHTGGKGGRCPHKSSKLEGVMADMELGFEF